MYKSIIFVVITLILALLMSQFHVFYPTAGKAYIHKHKEKRSIRPGSVYYAGSHGFRAGK